MNNKIDRENFLKYLKPVYDQYNPDFHSHNGMKNMVDTYINNKYPSVKTFAYVFKYRVLFSEKIQQSQKDGSYHMILLNAITVRSFLRFYEYVLNNFECKVIYLDQILNIFGLEYNNKTHLRYLLQNDGCPYDEWIDVFGIKNQIETAINNYKKETT